MAIETSNISATSLTGSLYGTASYALETPFAQQAATASISLGTLKIVGTDVTDYASIMQFNALGLPITSYTNPNVKWIPVNAFLNATSLAAVDIPNVTHFGGTVFTANALTKISLPLLIGYPVTALLLSNQPSIVSASFDSLTTINANAFTSCTSLRYLYVPRVRTVGFNIFTNFSATPANSGSIWINSAVTASADWNTAGNLQRLQSKGWTINYVNN